MKALLLFTITWMLAGWSGCKKNDATFAVPKCIHAEIQRMKSEPVTDPAGSVWRYTYNGQTVYYVPANACCDMQSTLYNSSCEVICHPDGGFSGHGDGQCSDFFTTRQDETLVWQDNR